MKATLKIVGSFLLSLALLVVGAHIRRPYSCVDCYELHGFPFAYHQDGGYGGGGASYPLGVVGNVLTLILLTALIAWGWGYIARRRNTD